MLQSRISKEVISFIGRFVVWNDRLTSKVYGEIHKKWAPDYIEGGEVLTKGKISVRVQKILALLDNRFTRDDLRKGKN